MSSTVAATTPPANNTVAEHPKVSKSQAWLGGYQLSTRLTDSCVEGVQVSPHRPFYSELEHTAPSTLVPRHSNRIQPGQPWMEERTRITIVIVVRNAVWWGVIGIW